MDLKIMNQTEDSVENETITIFLLLLAKFPFLCLRIIFKKTQLGCWQNSGSLVGASTWQAHLAFTCVWLLVKIRIAIMIRTRTILILFLMWEERVGWLGFPRTILFGFLCLPLPFLEITLFSTNYFRDE